MKKIPIDLCSQSSGSQVDIEDIENCTVKQLFDLNDTACCEIEYCQQDILCPELQPRLSMCRNKIEGNCTCKVFCRQQMLYLR